MTAVQKKDPGRSVYQRLLNLARKRGDDFNLILTRYGMERLLYRLSLADRKGRFVLKGASMFLVWHKIIWGRCIYSFILSLFSLIFIHASQCPRTDRTSLPPCSCSGADKAWAGRLRLRLRERPFLTAHPSPLTRLYNPERLIL